MNRPERPLGPGQSQDLEDAARSEQEEGSEEQIGHTQRRIGLRDVHKAVLGSLRHGILLEARQGR